MPSLNGWTLTPARRVESRAGGYVAVRELPGPEGAPAVLLLHGLGATSGLQFTPTLVQLATEFRVVAIDMRRAPKRSEIGSIFTTVADDAADVLQDAGIERAVVLGYSIGGLVARVVAQRHPSSVQGLVLAATFDAPRPGPLRSPLDFAARAIDQLPTLPMPSPPDDAPLLPWIVGEVGKLSPRVLLEAARDAAWIDVPNLAELGLPTAFVITTRDRVIRPSVQRALAATLPDAPVLEVEAGHAASGLSPDRFGPVALQACRLVVAAAQG